METVAFCESEPFCQDVLRKNWPYVPIYCDVCTLTADTLRRDGIAVDVIAGGFPCQDISIAGEQAGLQGERSGLWSEFRRLIREMQPQWVIIENVTGILSEGGTVVVNDIATSGYDCLWECIPASAIGALHRRDRWWCIAHRNGVGLQARKSSQSRELENWNSPTAGDWWTTEPNVARVVHGIPNRAHRIKALGNAVVPQITEMIGRAIMEAAK